MSTRCIKHHNSEVSKGRFCFYNENFIANRFSNNGLTHSQMLTLIGYLSEDSCPVTNLFLDWNPIYQEEFKAGDSVPAGTNVPYEILPP